MSLQGEGHPTRDGEAGNIGRRENSRSTFKALGPRPPPPQFLGLPLEESLPVAARMDRAGRWKPD